MTQSAYEKDRVIPPGFGDTEMGRDLLSQDYLLKQLTASLMHPEETLGAEFWKRVYAEAKEKFGTTDIPLNTFNKVWIVPQKAVVYVHGKTVFVMEGRLKVMMEEDYKSEQWSVNSEQRNKKSDVPLSTVHSALFTEIVLPAIEREVNEGKAFANLRQIYHAVILAVWFKKNLRDSVLGQSYVDQNKTKGVDFKDKNANQNIYNQYLEAFKKGAYDLIKEDYDPDTQEIIPRQYFSGGVDFKKNMTTVEEANQAMLSSTLRQLADRGAMAEHVVLTQPDNSQLAEEAGVGKPSDQAMTTAVYHRAVQDITSRKATARIKIPQSLRTLTGGLDEVAASGDTIATLINDMEKKHPGIGERVLDADGKLRRFVNISVNGKDIAGKLETPLQEGDRGEVTVAIADGRDTSKEDLSGADQAQLGDIPENIRVLGERLDVPVENYLAYRQAGLAPHVAFLKAYAGKYDINKADGLYRINADMIPDDLPGETVTLLGRSLQGNEDPNRFPQLETFVTQMIKAGSPWRLPKIEAIKIATNDAGLVPLHEVGHLIFLQCRKLYKFPHC